MEPEASGNRKSGLIRWPALAGSVYRANRSNTHRPSLLAVSEKTEVPEGGNIGEG